jgi:signal transduction histidine kinase
MNFSIVPAVSYRMPSVTHIHAPEELTPPQRAALRAALPLAFPREQSAIRYVASLTDALEFSPHGEREVVLLGQEEHSTVEQALLTQDNRKLPRWAVVLVGVADGPVGAEAISWDDFEPRLLARALRSSAGQLALRRKLARERGDVWTIGRRLTHDLRNPLGCIVTTAEMLKEVLQDEIPTQAALIDPILDATTEMLDLINRVHVMAKASAQPREPERFDMEAPLQATIERLQREITRRRAKITTPEVWPEVAAVRPWMETVWWNLVANALRHGGDPPEIEAGWRREGDEWVFFVADAGPGVQADRLKHLFTPFDQLHQRHGGGIGLSIVHRMVELHGGRCGYATRSEGGAVFSFTLPVTEEQPNPETQSAGALHRPPERALAAQPSATS